MLPPEIDPTDATTAVFQSIAHMIQCATVWVRVRVRVYKEF